MGRVLAAGFAMLILVALEPAPAHGTVGPMSTGRQALSPPTGGTTKGGWVVEASKKGHPKRGHGATPVSTSEWPKAKVLDCGPPKVVPGTGAIVGDGNNCSAARTECSVNSADRLPKDPHLTTTVTLTQKGRDAPWLLSSTNCHATTAKPQLTPWMVREELVKLVKPVAIASAPPPPKAVLVNVQWIAWIPTEANRSLGTVPMLGVYQVSLRIHLDHVTWDYGDGSTDVTDEPGRAYDQQQPCRTRLCSDYLGHVYTKDGHYTASATLTWAGQYSVDGGEWQDVPGGVTVNGPGLPVTIVQARSGLIPDGAHS